MRSRQPEVLQPIELRGRRLQEAESDILGICEEQIERALASADKGFEQGDLDPVQALQILARINAARKIMQRFRKVVREGIAAGEALHGER